MTSLAISLGIAIAMSLGAASTSRIGMGVVIVGGTIFSLVLTLLLFRHSILCGHERKHYPEFH
jgi:HAE1 family hydrophobic/amphiphilic exporter-1/multidrug efflux pump